MSCKINCHNHMVVYSKSEQDKNKKTRVCSLFASSTFYQFPPLNRNKLTNLATMGMVQKRKKMHYGDTHLRRRWRVRSRTRDLDQIDQDIQTQSAELINQPIDLEQPGMGQFYCVHCAKYFINDHAMQAHFRTKVHKRRMKALEMEPYTVEEAERAAGQGSYKAPKKRVMETQPSKEEVKKGKRIRVEEKIEDDEAPKSKRKVEKMQT